MKIVVTGGAGFIGANLCRELLSRPDVTEVVAFDNLSTGYVSNLDGVDVRLVEGSILDRPSLTEVVSGAHAVVHLAARPSVPRSVADPIASHEANVTGSIYVLEACRAARIPVIAASSSSVYGPTPELPKHEQMPTSPQSPYAASKLAAESYMLAYGATYGIPTLAMRFFNVYGPLQSTGHAYAAVIPAFIDAALRDRPLTVHGDGTQTRDFTYVGTVVRVLADAALRQVSHHRPVNLAFGTRVPLLNVIERIGDILGKRLAINYVPSRVGDVRDSQAANSSLKTLFPDLSPTSLETGLQATLTWYKRRLQSASMGPAIAQQRQATDLHLSR